ncbi:hypothetical protein BJ742DRAFT_491339 [Cladochytrium replicatum]|nr:hypothetical protein BJ742DRAFT_491339 [Cladochytrium replicatum]
MQHVTLRATRTLQRNIILSDKYPSINRTASAIRLHLPVRCRWWSYSCNPTILNIIAVNIGFAVPSYHLRSCVTDPSPLAPAFLSTLAPLSTLVPFSFPSLIQPCSSPCAVRTSTLCWAGFGFIHAALVLLICPLCTLHKLTQSVSNVIHAGCYPAPLLHFRQRCVGLV